MCDQCHLAKTSAHGVLDPFRVGASPYVLMSVKKTEVYTDEFKTIAVFVARNEVRRPRRKVLTEGALEDTFVI